MARNWKARDRKQHRKKTGMRISGRSVLIIPEIHRKRAEKLKEKKQND